MATKMQTPNAAVLSARARRDSSQAVSASNIEWYIKEVSDKITMTLERRMQVTVEYLRSKVVKNISKPVDIVVGPKGGKNIVRSKPGEFPRADTTMLMKTVFGDVKKTKTGVSGYLGTPMSYGPTLELEMERQFLTRTLYEEKPTVVRLLTGPIA